MTNELPDGIQRILVAFDNSRRNSMTLKTAAELAADLKAELHGLFVEDESLLRLAEMPFGCEIGGTSASSRPLNREIIERTFRVDAKEAKRALIENAQRAKVKWTFQICRGQLRQMTFAAADDADVTIVAPQGTFFDGLPFANRCRDGSSRFVSSSSLFRQKESLPQLVVIIDGTRCAMRAIQIALQLCQKLVAELIIYLAPTLGTSSDKLRDLIKAAIDEQPRSKTFGVEVVSTIEAITGRLEVGKHRIRLALLNRTNLMAGDPLIQLLIHHLRCPLALVR